MSNLSWISISQSESSGAFEYDCLLSLNCTYYQNDNDTLSCWPWAAAQTCQNSLYSNRSENPLQNKIKQQFEASLRGLRAVEQNGTFVESISDSNNYLGHIPIGSRISWQYSLMVTENPSQIVETTKYQIANTQKYPQIPNTKTINCKQMQKEAIKIESSTRYVLRRVCDTCTPHTHIHMAPPPAPTQRHLCLAFMHARMQMMWLSVGRRVSGVRLPHIGLPDTCTFLHRHRRR